jgi:hypothetical protein
VHLGYRLGHIKSDTRVFRALVYNKGAAVVRRIPVDGAVRQVQINRDSAAIAEFSES